MNIAARVMAKVTILDLSGDFTYASRGAFKAAVERARQADCRHLVLNMEQVRFLDSSALGMLALYSQSFRASRASLSLLRPQSYIREIMTLANMHNLLPLYESEAEMFASLPIALPG